MLHITWPAPDGFTDEAMYAFSVLREKGSIAQRVVELVFGMDVLQKMLASIGTHPPEREPTLAKREWEKTEYHGFTPGDEDAIDEVPEDFAPVRGRIEALVDPTSMFVAKPRGLKDPLSNRACGFPAHGLPEVV